MDLLDSFSCQLHHTAFDRLKSHTPLPCPGTQSINIPMKFHCVYFILNFTIANTVISKKSYFRLRFWWNVIYVQREQQGTKNGALGDTRQDRSPIRVCSIYNNSSEVKKRIYPFQCLATNSKAKQFSFKEFMRGCIKCFSKSNLNVSTWPLLSKILAKSFITVVNWVSQLCPFLNACCLSDRSLYSSRWAMVFEHAMFSSNLRVPFVNCRQFMYLVISLLVLRAGYGIWLYQFLIIAYLFTLHKSRKLGDNCMQVTCCSFWKGDRYLQESIPFGFHQCQLIAEKDEQIPDLTLLLAPLGL